MDKKCPCKRCQTRRFYATRFDMHIWGEDCPYECEDYEGWKSLAQEKEVEKEGEQDDT